MASGEIMFKISGLSHYYNQGQENQVVALADINLEIKRGEFVTVIGTNGSGKSTLAKHLNALLLPSKGRVLVKDMDTRDAGRLWDIRQTVGITRTPITRLWHDCGRRCCLWSRKSGHSPAEIRRRVDEVLAVVDMEEFRQAAPTFSRRPKQRVAIAGVIAMPRMCSFG